MQTIMLCNTPRKGSRGKTFTIQVVGDSPIKDAARKSIQELEHHPASSANRSLIDMLALIEQYNFQIRYTEHFHTDDDLEGWMFILQG